MLQALQRRVWARRPVSTPARAVQSVVAAPPSEPATFARELESRVDRLKQSKEAWRTTPLPDKIALLKKLRGRLLDEMHSWARTTAATRGLDNDPLTVAEAFLTTPVILAKYIDSLVSTLEHVQRTGKAPEPAGVRTLANGQHVIKVYPLTDAHKADVTLAGITSELYIQPGKPVSLGGIYVGEGRNRPQGQLMVVLGAGNVGFLAFKDVLHALFEEGHVVLFKPHPVQADWQRFADHVMEPLSSRGFVQTLYASTVEETQQMLYHPAVECVHMTGGTATHDAIVWGSTPEEQARRKAANDPLLKVPITSELGCVTPWIVTPGEWSEKHLDLQAASAAQALHFNNSCACNSLKVLVLPQAWPQADAFLNKIKANLRALKAQPAWYPGHNARYNAWRQVFPQAELVQQQPWPSTRDFGGAQPMPFAIQEVPYPEPGQPLTEQQRYAFTVEPFAPTLAVVRVPGAAAPDFLRAAVDLCNGRLWGTLSCTLLVPPDAQRDHAQAVEQAIDELRYGTVGVNCYSGTGYLIPHNTWGAFGGDQTLEHIVSGVGQVNNSLLVDHVQKSVFRNPIDGSANVQPLEQRGLPAWAYTPLTGLILEGLGGAVRASFLSR